MNIFKLVWTGVKNLRLNLKDMKTEHINYQKGIRKFNKSLRKQINNEI